MILLSLFQKEGFEIWRCSFVSELKLRSTSSAEQNFANEITWITWKIEQNLEIWPFLNSRLEMWVWESGRKIDPATGVKDFRWFIRHPSSVMKGAALEKSIYPQFSGSIPAENKSSRIHMDLSK